MQERVSVVIPAYRAERFIARSVGSALAQSWPELEVVVVSDDGTDYLAVLRGMGIADARIRGASTHGVGTGPASARNAGLAAASGRLVATLDADDLLEPGALQALAPLALRHGAAYGRVRRVDDASGSEMECLDREIPSGAVGLEEILTSQLHTYAGIVFDRMRVSATWPEWMERWEDVFFYVKCFDELDSIHHLAEPLYAYHRVPGSICNRAETGAEYLAWADLLADRLEGGETLGLENPISREIFLRFLRSRHTIEAEFIRAIEAGGVADWHQFMRNRPDLFHSLAVGRDHS